RVAHVTKAKVDDQQDAESRQHQRPPAVGQNVALHIAVDLVEGEVDERPAFPPPRLQHFVPDDLGGIWIGPVVGDGGQVLARGGLAYAVVQQPGGHVGAGGFHAHRRRSAAQFSQALQERLEGLAAEAVVANRRPYPRRRGFKIRARKSGGALRLRVARRHHAGRREDASYQPAALVRFQTGRQVLAPPQHLFLAARYQQHLRTPLDAEGGGETALPGDGRVVFAPAD